MRRFTIQIDRWSELLKKATDFVPARRLYVRFLHKLLVLVQFTGKNVDRAKEPEKPLADALGDLERTCKDKIFAWTADLHEATSERGPLISHWLGALAGDVQRNDVIQQGERFVDAAIGASAILAVFLPQEDLSLPSSTTSGTYAGVVPVGMFLLVQLHLYRKRLLSEDFLTPLRASSLAEAGTLDKLVSRDVAVSAEHLAEELLRRYHCVNSVSTCEDDKFVMLKWFLDLSGYFEVEKQDSSVSLDIQTVQQGGKEKATSFLEFSVKASGERILGLVGGPGRPIIRLSLDRWEVYLGQSLRPMSPPVGFGDGLRTQVLQLAGLTPHEGPLLHLEGAWQKLSLDMRSAKPKAISSQAKRASATFPEGRAFQSWEVRELEIVPELEQCQKYEAFVSLPEIGINNPIQEIVDPSRVDSYFSVVRCAKHHDDEPDTRVGWDGNGPIRIFPGGFKATTATHHLHISCKLNRNTGQIHACVFTGCTTVM